MRRRPSRCWRALVESPLLLSVWFAIVMACLTVHDVAAALRRAEIVRGAVSTAMARVAAETAAVRHLPVDGDRGFVKVGEVAVTMQRNGDAWQLTSSVGGRSRTFRAVELAGAMPAAFAHGCSVVDPRLVPGSHSMFAIGETAFPAIDERVLAGAPRADQTPMLRRDRGIALLTWEKGTASDDFVFDNRHTNAGSEAGAGELLVVPGHLWIEPADQPLRLSLRRDLVLAVRGNVYVGRSIAVEGGGRLVIVAIREPGAAVFADVDGNGCWSNGDVLRGTDGFRGPPEGAGSVWFGLPGSERPLSIDASIVVGGEAHLRATTHVAGPVVLAFGLTQQNGRSAQLVAEGRWKFDVERERVAGFAAQGDRRLGLLTPCAPN